MLEEKTRLIDDCLRFQESLNKIYISKKILNLCRILYRQKVYEDNQNNLKRLKKIKSGKRMISSVICNQSYFICIKSIEEKRAQKRNDPFFLFRLKSELKNFISKDYFSDTNNAEASDCKIDGNFFIEQHNSNNQLEEDKFLICRHNHICVIKIDEQPIDKLSSIQFSDEKNESEQEEVSSQLMQLIKKSCEESFSNKSYRTYSFEKSLKKNKPLNRNSYSPTKETKNQIMSDAKGIKRSKTVFESNGFISENLGKSNFNQSKLERSMISELENDMNGS